MGDITGNSKKAAEKARLRRGKKHKKTILKEAFGIDRANAIYEQIDKNIEEFTKHKDPKIRLEATKAFADYYKPRKKESNLNIKGTINFVVNKNFVPDNPDGD